MLRAENRGIEPGCYQLDAIWKWGKVVATIAAIVGAFFLSINFQNISSYPLAYSLVITGVVIAGLPLLKAIYDGLFKPRKVSEVPPFNPKDVKYSEVPSPAPRIPASNKNASDHKPFSLVPPAANDPKYREISAPTPKIPGNCFNLKIMYQKPYYSLILDQRVYRLQNPSIEELKCLIANHYDIDPRKILLMSGPQVNPHKRMKPTAGELVANKTDLTPVRSERLLNDDELVKDTFSPHEGFFLNCAISM